jgi:hypothetical protein
MNPHSLMRGIRSRVYPTSIELISQVGQARLEYPRIQSQVQKPQTLALDCRVGPGNEEASLILRANALNLNLGLGFAPQAYEEAPFSGIRMVANPLANPLNLNQKVKP